MRRGGRQAWEPRGPNADRARTLPVVPWRCAPASLGDTRWVEARQPVLGPAVLPPAFPGRAAPGRPLPSRVGRLARLFAAHAVAMATSYAPPGPAPSSGSPRSLLEPLTAQPTGSWGPGSGNPELRAIESQPPPVHSSPSAFSWGSTRVTSSISHAH